MRLCPATAGADVPEECCHKRSRRGSELELE